MNSYVELFLYEILIIIVFLIAGFIGSLIFKWFGKVGLVIYIIIFAGILTWIIGKNLE
jgi:hypothetical protein